MRFDRCHFRFRLGTAEHRETLIPGEKRNFTGLKISFSEKKSAAGMRYTLSLEADTPVELSELTLEGTVTVSAGDRVFCNGFQSWTESREFRPRERVRGLFPPAKLFKVDRLGDYGFAPHPGGRGRFLSHAYTYITDPGSTLRFAGSLAEDSGYTMFRTDAPAGRITAIKECRDMVEHGRSAPMDVLVLFGGEDDVFDRYFRELGVGRPNTPPRTGWTSRNYHYTNISERIILENLERFDRHNIPIDYFQIDDGYQTAVGDWLSIKDEFPGGMGRLAREIQMRGYRASLWLAPFICEEKSEIFRTQKDWLVQDGRGAPVPAGRNPLRRGNFYILDMYNRMVREYLKEVFGTMTKSWRYDMLKLDFLYAAALVPRRGRSRGTIMADAMHLLRGLTGRKTMLACGAPLGSAFGVADYCRIGSDVSPKWEDRILAAVRYRERVSTVNSLRSTIGRRHLNFRAFVNDPDVFILRDENNKMTRAQRRTLFLLNNIFGGLLFTSDDIGKYPPDIMRLYLSMFPLKKKKNLRLTEEKGLYSASFSIGRLDYAAHFNLSGKRRTTRLDESVHYHFDPLKNSAEYLNGYGGVELGPYESRLYLKIQTEPYTIAGSTGHLFPGSEIESLSVIGRRITLRQNRNVRIPNRIAVRVPAAGTYAVNGSAAEAEEALRGTLIVTMSM